MNEYLNNLITDINNPTYFQKLISAFDDVQITPLSNDTYIRKFLNSLHAIFAHMHVNLR